MIQENEGLVRQLAAIRVSGQARRQEVRAGVGVLLARAMISIPRSVSAPQSNTLSTCCLRHEVT